MRILQIAPPWESVPPQAYGGTEAVVSLLTEELVARGHDVTLVASGDSKTAARLVSTIPSSLRVGDYKFKQFQEAMHIARALRMAREFDIVHNHAGEITLAMSLPIDLPMLTTMHCEITPDTALIWQEQRGYYNTVSRAQAAKLPPEIGGVYLGHVHNAIDVDSFPFAPERGDYLLFLSRMSPEKGPDVAIEVARRLGKPLIMAGKIDPTFDRSYFEEVIAPLIDGDHIRFIGEADGPTKRRLYAGAECLLLPICWDEPFGLVMPEAMACGKPVVAFARGAAPELILHGETGFLAQEIDEFVDCVRRVGEIDPARCRSHVRANFTPQHLADGYLKLYAQMLSGEA
jgi:glycosyltransferase involved in cell wall biosynthesis